MTSSVFLKLSIVITACPSVSYACMSVLLFCTHLNVNDSYLALLFALFLFLPSGSWVLLLQLFTSSSCSFPWHEIIAYAVLMLHYLPL